MKKIFWLTAWYLVILLFGFAVGYILGILFGVNLGTFLAIIIVIPTTFIATSLFLNRVYKNLVK